MKVSVDPCFYKELPIHKVGVFVNESPDHMLELVEQFGLDYVQLHGDEDPRYLESIRLLGSVQIIKVFRIGTDWDWSLVVPFVGLADWFLFDTATPQFGGSGQVFSWDILLDYPFDRPFLLSGGINDIHAHQILELMRQVPAMKGVDINSKFELAPAFKDIPKIQAFIKELSLH